MFDLNRALNQVSEELSLSHPDPWDIVSLFENKLASYCNSKYAVALDSCTNALFLCLKYHNLANQTIEIPRCTYLSVPQVIIHSGNFPKFCDINWSGYYQLGTTGIYDSAGRIQKNMYISNSFMCLSFHRKKCIPIGKGGLILTDNLEAYNWMQRAVYEGRDRRQLHDDIQDIDILGWNMYMTPEAAAYGLSLLDGYFKSDDFDTTSDFMYNDISRYSCFV